MIWTTTVLVLTTVHVFRHLSGLSRYLPTILFLDGVLGMLVVTSYIPIGALIIGVLPSRSQSSPGKVIKSVFRIIFLMTSIALSLLIAKG